MVLLVWQSVKLTLLDVLALFNNFYKIPLFIYKVGNIGHVHLITKHVTQIQDTH